MTDEQPMLTLREAATMLGISESVMRRALTEGQVPHFRAGARGAYRIPVRWVRRVIDGETTVGAPGVATAVASRSHSG